MIGRLRVVALETPSQMCSARCETEYIAPRGVWMTLPAPQMICRVTRNGMRTSASLANSPCRRDEVVLVAAVGVAGRVGVVLEQVDVAVDALVAQPALGVDEQPLEDPLPRLVVGDQVDDVVALGGGVLRVAADVEVEPGAVAEEDVAGAAPGDDLAEEVPRDLVGAQPALPLERARDAVLVLDPEDPAVHALSLDRAREKSRGVVEPPRPSRGSWQVPAQVRGEIGQGHHDDDGRGEADP